MGGGGLSCDYVSKLGSKEVSKKLRNFTLAIKKACHCEDERSEDVAIAKSLNINEITTQSSIARNDKLRHAELVSASHNDTVFSRFTSHFSRKRVAFTQAEVLITLGIIGVVMALTLPSVISNYRQESYKSALKKNYSVLNQTFNMIYGSDYDDFNDWDYSRSYEFLNETYNKFASYLNIAKTCGHAVGCFERPKAKNGKYATHSSVYGFGNSNPLNFILSDGTAISLDYWLSTSVNQLGVSKNLISASANLVIGIDVNGSKGPNVSGVDVFAFVLTKKGLVPAGKDNDSINCDNRNVDYNYDCTAKYLK